MPFRFRKIISLGKGLRLNFSKRGMSASLGKPGAILNLGKRGIRPTVGLPGTGLSFTPSQNNANTTESTSSAGPTRMLSNGIIALVSAILLCVISVCCVGVIFTDTGSATSTPTIEVKSIDPAVIIANTSAAAQTQTMIAAPFTSTPFIFDTPTMQPPASLAPTWTIAPTDTPFVLATQAIIPAGDNVCSCAGDTLNCSDFSTRASAQACFNYCVAQGAGDIHKLDQNNDGNACESL